MTKSTYTKTNVTTGEVTEIPRKSEPEFTPGELRRIGQFAKSLGISGKNELTAHEQELIDGVKNQIARERLDAPRSMLNHRIRQLKRNGYSNVRIGAVLGIHESTVRRRLKAPMEPIEILLDHSLSDLEAVREELIGAVSSYPEFRRLFGDSYILRIHTTTRKVSIDPKLKRVRFSLDFSVNIREED